MQGPVPKIGNDALAGPFHYWNMAKPKHRKVARPGWYVKEWLEYLGLQQTFLIEATGRAKSRISELVTGTQRFNEDDLAAFSRALRVNRGFLLDVNPLEVGRDVAERGRLPLPPSDVRKAKN